MFNRTKLCSSMLVAFGGGVAAFSPMAQAQTAPSDTPTAERVEVTGSRVRRIDAEAAAPVQIVNREQIQQSGVVSIGALLQQLPSIAGAATNPQVNNGGGDGASTISLRGLGSERTLVLLDGRRLGAGFDVNSIPLNLIERVDILKQGAGATYGSDAIGGVVNIITQKNFTGFNVAAQVGAAGKGDAETKNLELTFGTSTDKGHVMAGLNFNKQGLVRSGDRKFSAQALYWYTYDGAVNVLKLGSSSTPQGRLSLPASTVLPNGKTAAEQFGCAGSTIRLTRKTGAAGTSLDDFRCYTGADSYDYQPQNLALTPQERVSLFVDASHQVTDAVELFATVLHNRTTSGFQIAPLPMVASNDGWATSANNPFGISFGSTAAGGAVGTNMQVRPVDLGKRQSNNATTLSQMTLGARGAITDSSWTWDLAYTYQGYRQNSGVSGYINGGLLQNALTNDAFNIFNVTADNPTGQASLVGLTPFSVGYTNFTSTNERTLDLVLTGDLYKWTPGTIQAAVGATYSKANLSVKVDELTRYVPPTYNSCLLAAETCGGDTSGTQNVREVFGELFIPLLKDMPGAKALNLTLGSRLSSYDSFGSTTNSSAKLEYRPVADLMVRGTASQVFRAPTISDRFGATQGTFPTFIDPCASATGNEPGYDRACQYIPPNSGYDQDNSQILGFLGGNKNLKPEQGKVFTLGFVYDSSLIKGFSVTADYWNDAISSGDPTTIAAACLNTPSDTFCNRIKRDPGTGQIDNIDLSNLNAGYIKTNGIDVSLRYMLPPTAYGRFRLGLDTSYTKSFKYDLGNGVEQEAAGTLDPSYGNFAKWRVSGNVQWGMGPFGVLWTSRYISSTNISNSKDSNFCSTATCQTILVRQGGVTYHDLALSYSMDKTKTKVIVGVNNVGDKQPPLAYQFQLNGNVDVQTYDTIGRRWFVRLEQAF
ncbi:TonB-dependent receptor [Ideonella sp. 4Y11]|uniref:TonB-dependent receptor n=1 Tax=Ideonella aquatica TaxID=2824119 RepID=A0A940YM37_9BURK|nr:TonB-dependent receptor [Ideonella aquatica]MBQ0959467.1 TonB-dependent receptor [Ideonella aquatica]